MSHRRKQMRESPLVRFLVDRKSYPEHPGRVRLIQTHASWVTLLPRSVYKVKKPVKLGFLDFSTIEKRRRFCEHEVALNRRLAPGIYLGVVPVAKGRAGLAFGGPGRVVDYAVKMRRLSASHFMSHLLRRGKITTRHLDRVVAALVAYYRAHPSSPEIARWGRIGIIRKDANENTRQTRPFVGRTISPAALEAIDTYNKGFLRRNGPLFAARMRDGKIRDCHGDLHLEHIHLGPKQVTIYDCIEFNERLRLIDIANDVAFLAMDLDFHGRPDLGRYFATRMAAELHDPDALRLLDFYKCYRACVRGKVDSLRSVATGLTGRERLASRRLAKDYFRLGLEYAVSGSQPLVLIVMGRVGSGKSTLARALGCELKWEVFSSDRVRKELAKVPLYQRGDLRQRKRLYSRPMSDRTYAALTRAAIREVRRGRSVILDATFGSRERRSALRRALKRTKANFCFIETWTSTPKIEQRLRTRGQSRNEISDARLEDFPILDRDYQAPSELAPLDLLVIKTSGGSGLAVTAALKALAHRSVCP